MDKVESNDCEDEVMIWSTCRHGWGLGSFKVSSMLAGRHNACSNAENKNGSKNVELVRERPPYVLCTTTTSTSQRTTHLTTIDNNKTSNSAAEQAPGIFSSKTRPQWEKSRKQGELAKPKTKWSFFSFFR
jgi:hypothetical protein